MVPTDTDQVQGAWEQLKAEYESELEKTKRELEEIGLMLEHSQHEVSKLAQRNASITAHLQQVQSQFADMPREDIRMAYDAALDAQQRLFVMRGQVEKLQSDQTLQRRIKDTLERTYELLTGGILQQDHLSQPSSKAERAEMMIQTQEAERQRLSRQMHDGPAQALSNFILQTEIAMRLFEMDQAKAKDELANLKYSATSTFQKVRDFIFELRPMMLDDLGLVPTLKRYVEAAKSQKTVELRLDITGQEHRLESYLEVMIFRAVQEIINNALRHSQATQVNVLLDLGDNFVRVVCDDNGSGFDKKILEERQYMGLKVIRERVEMLGGDMEIDSVIGQGTRITFQVPAGIDQPFA